MQGFAGDSDLPHDPTLRDKLAAWVASGRSIAAFAKDKDIPMRTCYSWSGTAVFKAKVRRIRRRMLDRVACTLTRHGPTAVGEMARLIHKADSTRSRLVKQKLFWPS